MRFASLGRNIGLVVILSSVVQLLLLARNLILTARLGPTENLDAFYLANNYTMIISNVLGVSVMTVLIPHLVDRAARDRVQPYVKWTIAGSIALSAIVTTVVYFFDAVIVGSFGRDGQWLFRLLVTILLVGQVFRIISSVATAVAQAENRFLIPKLAGVVPAVIPLAYLLVEDDLVVLCVVTVFSYLLEALLNLAHVGRTGGLVIFAGRTWKLNPESRALVRETLPVLLSSSVFQLQLLFMSTMAGRFGEGTITLFTNANQIVGVVQTLVISNVVLVMYPTIAAWVKTDLAAAMQRLAPVAALTNWLVIGLCWTYATVGELFVKVLFERDNFSADDTHTLWIYGLLLVAPLPLGVIRDYIYRVYYALGKARVASRNSIGVVVVTVVTVLIMARSLGIYSILVSLGIGSLTSLASIMYKTVRAGIPLHVRGFLLPSATYLAAGLFAWLATRWVPWQFHSPWVGLVVGACAVFAAYTAFTSPLLFRTIRAVRSGLAT